MGIEPYLSYFRIRVVKTFNAGNAEITNDLPHLHQSSIQKVAFQPGNPGSSALGSFTIRLHPPGSEGYAAAKPIYDQLDYFNRVECYISPDGASLSNLYYAGIVTGIRKTYDENAVFELTGHEDTVLANLSRPFPGELLSNDVTSAILKSYLGTNEAGWTDSFSTFAAGNYTSTNVPTLTAGTWSATTDDGFNVVTNSTGSGALLIAKTGAVTNDRWTSDFVEVTGRLKPSTDTTNAGVVGVGLSNSNANGNNLVVGRVQAYQSGSRWNLHAAIFLVVGGVITAQITATNILVNADDPQGYIPLTIGLLWSGGGLISSQANATMTVNGRIVFGQYQTGGIGPGPVGSTTWYPLLYFGNPLSGTANVYLMNLIQMNRYTTDGTTTAATFGNGTIGTATHSLSYGIDPGPTFLETWSRLATREGWYWRYTPQAYAIGTRTLGTVDFAADPGTDRGTNKQVVFSRLDGSLVSLSLNANADRFATDTATTGQSTLDGGGIGYWRDVNSISKYGVIQDEVLSFTHSDFNTLRRASYQIISNKVNLSASGSKTAVIWRDPQTADAWRELDKVMIHDPEMGINYLVARVMTYTFDEGKPTQALTLDQFSADFIG